MKIALINTFTDEEFNTIIQNSFSYKEVCQKLGYNSYSGKLVNMIKARIQNLNISTQHFKTKTPIKRTKQNIFCKDSTVAQKTLREWYKKENIQYKCSICGQEPFWNGKELTLILDHINGINNDDRLENLRWVCPNCNQQLPTTNGKNKAYKEKKKNYCIECGKEISLQATRCQSCAAKQQKKKVENRPSREELKQLIRKLPFTTIASNYGVSDNAIRKWCDSYNLPRKKTQIKAFSDREWSKI